MGRDAKLEVHSAELNAKLLPWSQVNITSTSTKVPKYYNAIAMAPQRWHYVFLLLASLTLALAASPTSFCKWYAPSALPLPPALTN